MYVPATKYICIYLHTCHFPHTVILSMVLWCTYGMMYGTYVTHTCVRMYIDDVSVCNSMKLILFLLFLCHRGTSEGWYLIGCTYCNVQIEERGLQALFVKYFVKCLSLFVSLFITCLNVYFCVCLWVCACVRTCVCAFVCTHTFVHMDTHTYYVLYLLAAIMRYVWV